MVCLVCFASIALASTITAPTISETKGKVTDTLQPTSIQTQQPTPQHLKEYLASVVAQYGGNYYLLAKVIQCESSWDSKAKNPDSSASGPAQFLTSTFNGYCKGEKDNPYDQIKCLVLAWNDKKEHWWSESKYCWAPLMN